MTNEVNLQIQVNDPSQVQNVVDLLNLTRARDVKVDGNTVTATASSFLINNLKANRHVASVTQSEVAPAPAPVPTVTPVPGQPAPAPVLPNPRPLPTAVPAPSPAPVPAPAPAPAVPNR